MFSRYTHYYNSRTRWSWPYLLTMESRTLGMHWSCSGIEAIEFRLGFTSTEFSLTWIDGWTGRWTDRWAGGRMDEWVDGQNGQVGAWINERMDRRMHGWMSRWTNRQMDFKEVVKLPIRSHLVHSLLKDKNSEIIDPIYWKSLIVWLFHQHHRDVWLLPKQKNRKSKV